MHNFYTGSRPGGFGGGIGGAVYLDLASTASFITCVLKQTKVMMGGAVILGMEALRRL